MNDPRSLAYQLQVLQMASQGYALPWQMPPAPQVLPVQYAYNQAHGYPHVPQFPQQMNTQYGPQQHSNQPMYNQLPYNLPPPYAAPQMAALARPPPPAPQQLAAQLYPHPYAELSRLAASEAMLEARALWAKTRRLAPCDQYDRLVAVAICARKVGESYESAMGLIAGVR